MGRIAELLPAMFAERFPQLVRVPPRVPPSAPGVCVAFAAPPGIGTIEISDDGSEASLFIGDLTHGHFMGYPARDAAEAARLACEDVLRFIDDFIHDRVVVWKGAGGGGWRYLEAGGVHDLPKGATAFVWSGPVPRSAS